MLLGELVENRRPLLLYIKHELMELLPRYEVISTLIEEGVEDDGGRNKAIFISITIDFDNLNRQTIINRCPKRGTTVLSARTIWKE